MVQNLKGLTCMNTEAEELMRQLRQTYSLPFQMKLQRYDD
jgi:hypothetical protein